MEIKLSYPQSWEDVTREQLLVISSLMLKKRTREELLMDLFCRLACIRVAKWKAGIDEGTPQARYFFFKGKKQFSLSVEAVAKACEDLSFLVDKIGLPESPLLSINTKLYGISFKQYYFADAYFHKYQDTKEVAYFCMMHNALTGFKIKKPEKNEIFAVTIWWTGLKEYFKNKYPNVLKEGDGTSNDRTPADTLQEILAILNGNKPHENNQILESEVNSVLLALELIYASNKDAK